MKCASGSMDRASDSGSEGWGFESLLAYQTEQIRTLQRCSSSAVCLVFVSPDFPAGRFAVDCKMGKEKICPTAPKRVAVGFFLRFYSISTRRTASAVDSAVNGFLNASLNSATAASIRICISSASKSIPFFFRSASAVSSALASLSAPWRVYSTPVPRTAWPHGQ